MAARALGFIDLDDAAAIALMDEAKESWEIDVKRWQRESFGRGANVWYPCTHLTGRQYLQHFGNEARKVFGATFWIDQVLPQPSEHPDPESRWASNDADLARRYPGIETLCITDLRYPNEAERIIALGGTIWEVIRPGTASDGHVSEIPLPRHLVDMTIPNMGTLDDLRDEVRIALEVSHG